MKLQTLLFAVTCLATSVSFSTSASAKDLGDGVWAKERFQIRVRAIGVLPDEDAPVNIGGDLEAGDAITPEVDITYFLNEHWALELITATSEHSFTYSVTNGDLGEAMLLPPTLTLQYHPLSDQTFSPYLGAGVNYSYFYSEDAGTGFTDLEVDGGFGVALQAGADYWLNDNWGLNVDVKKVFLDVDAELNNGAITSDVELDPWIVGAGVSYRF